VNRTLRAALWCFDSLAGVGGEGCLEAAHLCPGASRARVYAKHTEALYRSPMILRTTRALTDAETREVIGTLPLFALGTRREVRSGAVEVIMLDVKRVWPLISCLRQGCCPYTWLIDTGDEYVFFRSWDLLPFVGHDFPGEHVVIERLPHSGRIVSARASGNVVAVQPHPERPWEAFSEPSQDFTVIPRGSVRAEALAHRK
jgi:hypothetical protein